ncbi:MAG: methyltransferase domain-containing protein, partial [Clostridia bacterium]
IEYLNLGNIPLVNNLCTTREESLSCQKYPLAIQFFPESKLTSLTEIVNKDNLFLNYLYRSGVNKPYLEHCAKMYDYLSRYIDFRVGDIIADIGGNDGSLLLEFKKENQSLRYVNVDCSQTFIDVNKEHNIEYINEYFSSKTVLPYKAKLITSTNVFQHTEPIRSFVQGIQKNLTGEGIWCLEFPYILTTLANDNYDQVYHEHVYYYCLKNIIDLLDQEGLRVINVSYHDMHAGTLRVLSVKKSSQRQADSTIESFLNLEKTLTTEYVIKWGQRTHEKIQGFKTFIGALKQQRKTVACFGAAAKGCVFLNTCGIDYTMIKFIIDDTLFKQGKFVPGTGIEVVSREVLKDNHIDYILILAHNFRDYIIKSLEGQYYGKFIVMFPDIKEL